MKQLIQNFKNGDLYVDEIPLPSLQEAMVLIETEYSLISAGTERGSVKVAQANMFNKAKQRPDLVKQILENFKKEGFSATLSKVRTKLDSLKALGYSSSGVVMASLDTKSIFKVGDRVACAGQDYASHAEVVAVPQNLVAKIPENVSSEEAAFTTIGAIALQGVRQADPKLGEKACVIGLGLLGQITGQLLRANGCHVLAVDYSDYLIDFANKNSVDKALHRNDSNLLSACENFTNGNGFDFIIITAATPTNDPIILSTKIARKKGRIVIVGSVKMDIPREPFFYKKELELKISCSYGPGRYDSDYEENGHDYPIAYVRWTEQRNMSAFLELLSKGLVDVKPLLTHKFDIEEAEYAYDIILGKTQVPHIGILLKYGNHSDKKQTSIQLRNAPNKNINIGFVGAGSFAQSYLIPNVKTLGASLDGVVTSKGITSKNVADKFKFNFCSTEANDVILNPQINTVMVATPHSSHANFVIRSLNAKKNVFVEKPLAINPEQLAAIIKARQNTNALLMVGFNRRFAPISKEIKKEFVTASTQMIINIRINAGAIPRDHWIQQPHIGGGRIIGEICHFIDLMQFFTDSDPIKVFADSINIDNELVNPDDNLSVIIKFSDGSIGNIIYVANGDKSLPKEMIEIFCAGKVATINDFKEGKIYKDGKCTTLRSSGKGHKEELEAFFNAMHSGLESPISFRSICLTTLTTFKIKDSIASGLPQNILLNEL